ncbi:hypothetical protein BDV59DRAFT_200603 [Aspergillus ambiguus]|uniref:ribonuclease H family protein n=1 Tax=Aspergillus ambiguus TaxID=176160 RepID=UPI003CCDDEFB
MDSQVLPSSNTRKKPAKATGSDTDHRDHRTQGKQGAKERRQRLKRIRRNPAQAPKRASWTSQPTLRHDGFCALLKFDTRPDAHKFAQSIDKEPDQFTRVFWTDGSYQAKGAGAGVVYRAGQTDASLVGKGYAVPGLEGIREVELFAIGVGLKLAVEAYATPQPAASSPSTPPSSSSRSSQSSSFSSASLTAPVVVVLTDSADCIRLLRDWLTAADSWKQVSTATTRMVRQIIRFSHQLREAGVQLQVRWVPGHSGIKGNKAADQFAKAAVNIRLADRNMTQSQDGTVLLLRGVGYLEEGMGD